VLITEVAVFLQRLVDQLFQLLRNLRIQPHRATGARFRIPSKITPEVYPGRATPPVAISTDSRGTAVRPIYGPSLDGTLPGNEVIVQSRAADRVMYAPRDGPDAIPARHLVPIRQRR